MALPLSCILLSLATTVTSQSTSQPLCAWQLPRAGVVREALYLEGGLQWVGDWQNGEFEHCTTNQKSQSTYGSLFKLNFTRRFDTSKDDLRALFEPINETLNGNAAFYVGGGMFTNNYEWYTYGGLAYPQLPVGGQTTGAAHDALYQGNALATGAQYGPKRHYGLPDGITKYVTNGADASAPSESLGFYFSGLQSYNGSELNSQNGGNTSSDFPGTLVKSLLKVDTSSPGNAKWTEISLPTNVLPRAEASMVWLPIGSRGALAVIGGVVQSGDLYAYDLNDTQRSQNNNQNPNFMTNIPIYDIGNNIWYVQPTSGGPPPQRGLACAVVASASDNSSHNVYVYGGYDGNSDINDKPYDDVWVLSLPAFKWIQATAGNTAHGRSSHVCATPYPDQMFVVGGIGAVLSPLATQNIIDVYNLSSLTWTGKYDPAVGSAYRVPSAISQVIGGDSSGNANLVAQMDTGLTALFNAPYGGLLPKWYPYASAPNPNSSSGGNHKWLIPVIVVIVVIGVIGAGLILWWCCRPAARRRRSEAASQATTTRGRVARWLHHETDPVAPKSVATSETVEVPGSTGAPSGPFEADSYFKPMYAAEMESASSPPSTRYPHSDNTSPARSPGSPGSNRSEVQGSAIPHELDGALKAPFSIRNHPMYPPSLVGPSKSFRSHTVSSPSELGYGQTTVHSPSQGSILPYELAENHSSEDVPSPPELDLNRIHSRPNHNNTSHVPAQAHITSASDISPELPPVHAPIRAPPTALSNPANQPSGHTRNNSSLDSGLTQLSATVSPGEDRRRSDQIATLPDYPTSPRRRHDLPGRLVRSAYDENSEINSPEFPHHTT